MEPYVAFLRAVNVGGKNILPMADLRDVATQFGLTDPETLLQSGNLFFRSELSPQQIQSELEGQILVRFGFEVKIMLRTLSEMNAIVTSNPLPNEAANAPSKFLVMFLGDLTDSSNAETLQARAKDGEQFAMFSNNLYGFFPNGLGSTKLTTSVIEKIFGTAGTGRNWNTVLKAIQILDRLQNN